MASDRICAMPTASVGAPPVREMTVCSPTSFAVCVIISGVTWKPHCEMAWVADSAVVPMIAPGLFMAK